MEEALNEHVAEPMREILAAFKPLRYVYCDYIADRIRHALLPRCNDGERIASVGHVQSDLHPEGGYLVSTKKTIELTDHAGTRYRVTVEEIEQ